MKCVPRGPRWARVFASQEQMFLLLGFAFPLPLPICFCLGCSEVPARLLDILWVQSWGGRCGL